MKPKLADSPYAVPLVASLNRAASSSHPPAAKRAPKEMSSVPEMGPSKYMKPVDLHADVRNAPWLLLQVTFFGCPVF